MAEPSRIGPSPVRDRRRRWRGRGLSRGRWHHRSDGSHAVARAREDLPRRPRRPGGPEGRDLSPELGRHTSWVTTSLDQRSLAELANAVSPGSRVLRVRRLGGGLTALMHAVDLDAPGGRRLRLVVRRYRPEFDQGSETARRESLLLTRLLACGLPVPEPVWLDAEGSFLGLPTLV